MNNREGENFSSEKDFTRREFLYWFLGGSVGVGSAFLGLRNDSAFDVQGLEHRVYLPIISTNNNGINIKGLCYSPYRDGQDPDWGPYPTEEDIKKDIDTLEPIVGYLRTYGTDHNLENIPRYVLEKGSGIKVNAGCWLGSNLETNDILINNLISEVNNFSNVFSVTVGNETQQFGTISEDQLINYINRVKQTVPANISVTTGDTWYSWTQHPRLVSNVDYIFAHFFPYWEPNPVPIDSAVGFIENKYRLLQSLYPGKKVVIGEAGWPSDGQIRGEAVPSLENQRRFINEFLNWTVRNNVDFYFFDAFDENWKTKYEGEVGKHWGLYNSNRTAKHPGITFK